MPTAANPMKNRRSGKQVRREGHALHDIGEQSKTWVEQIAIKLRTPSNTKTPHRRIIPRHMGYIEPPGFNIQHREPPYGTHDRENACQKLGTDYPNDEMQGSNSAERRRILGQVRPGERYGHKRPALLPPVPT